jgi:hypothetical protein
MPKSRKDKSRKENLNNFKKTKQKSMEAPKFKPFRQVPHWEPDADIVIKGTEFNMLQNFFNVFAEPINVMQDIFARNLNDGVITVKYLDNDGKEVSKEEVQAYMTEMKNYLNAEAEKIKNQSTEEPVTGDPSEAPVEVTEEKPKAKSKLKVV